ncbi:hypothetical protein V6N13_133288 [Hibiscus sabdariffa]
MREILRRDRKGKGGTDDRRGDAHNFAKEVDNYTLSRFFIFSTGSGELTIENGRERGLHWSIFLQSLDSISGPGTQLKDIPNESGLFFSDIVNCFSGFQVVEEKI